ncbi:helix-turn-helix transcriptional regulator [Erysipelothrix rhusiopathiae]|uniref:helix-turn-helix domain-containing protein n=1 Tax=Erysipelothrix rhusiopathiae TaxID=1648 RepID=UPI002B245310|nr:helix-turn-helix transcriptional regulator [Erysipelothrix rhusiopathiae]WRB93064.1 helix-turn-helix transcriptional regulator [Erysipelothrix rhusiopathiae]
MKLSDNLKRLREENALTQDKVAQSLNVSRQAVSNWEQGKRYPDAIMLIQISEFYGVPVDDLLKSDKEYAKALVIDKARFEEVLFVGVQILMMIAIFFWNDVPGMVFIFMGCILVSAFTEEVCEYIEWGLNNIKIKK